MIPLVADKEDHNTALAVKISHMINAGNDHLVGVLLTQAEASIANDRQLEAFKSLLRRELYNAAKDNVSYVHQIVKRAEVISFREHPTLDEQLLAPTYDSMDFSNKTH